MELKSAWGSKVPSTHLLTTTFSLNIHSKS